MEEYDSLIPEAELQEKLRGFQELIETKLKVELQHFVSERDVIANSIAGYNELRHTIEEMKQQHSTLKNIETQLDLGYNFSVQAIIPDANMVFVDVGLGGFHVEFTLDEAIVFIQQKNQLLHQRSVVACDKANLISNHINLVLQGIEELKLTSTAARQRTQETAQKALSQLQVGS